MAVTSKLIVYNEVLRELSGHPLANLTTDNTSLRTLNGAFDHAIEYLLATMDWSFSRRRATLTGVTDSGFPPYSYRYNKPTDYLRKCWIKRSATDSFQIDHAEVGATIYGFLDTAVVEYVSDHADNYDPANWPPHFTRCAVLYLASRVAPTLARAGDDVLGRLNGQFESALAAAEGFEANFLTNTQIAANRLPTMRRALEFMGQVLAGTVSIMSQADKLRWSMNEAWDHCLKFVLEQGAWNFATRRARLVVGNEPVPGDTYSSIIEGYSVPPALDPDEEITAPDMAGWAHGHVLPDDFLHKIWLKSDANNFDEIPHQFMRDAVYCNYDSAVMEYIAWDEDSTNPGEWPASFLEAVAAYLALTVSPEIVIGTDAKGNARINANDLRQKLEAVYVGKLRNAKNRDAIQQYPQQIAPGRFVRARAGSSFSSRRYR